MKESKWYFTLTCSCPITLPKGLAKCQLHLESTREQQGSIEDSYTISLSALAAFFIRNQLVSTGGLLSPSGSTEASETRRGDWTRDD